MGIMKERYNMLSLTSDSDSMGLASPGAGIAYGPSRKFGNSVDGVWYTRPYGFEDPTSGIEIKVYGSNDDSNWFDVQTLTRTDTTLSVIKQASCLPLYMRVSYSSGFAAVDLGVYFEAHNDYYLGVR